MNYHTEKLENIVTNLETSLENGLSSEIARKNQEKYGLNELPTKPGKTLFAMFLSQLNDWLIYILL